MPCRNPRQSIGLTTVRPKYRSRQRALVSLSRVIFELWKDADVLFKYRFFVRCNDILIRLFFHNKNLLWNFINVGGRVLNAMEIEDRMHLGGLVGGYCG